MKKLFWCRCQECNTNKPILLDENLSCRAKDCFCKNCDTYNQFKILREVEEKEV